MTGKQKKTLIRIIISAIIFLPLLIAEHTGVMEELPDPAVFAVFLIPYIISGYDVLKKAFVNISHGRVFDENFLMMIATFGAFGVKEYSEAVAVMLFYQVGELFQSYAVGKSRQSISDMMDMAPEYANLEEGDAVRRVDPDEVEIGSIVIIRPGEKVPLDGVVIEGESMIDTSALTGESVPRRATAGDELYSGCINGSGTLKLRTTKEYDDSTVARILELVENAGEKKARVENFITRFARYYTPAVTISAVALAAAGPVISGGGLQSVSTWLLRACTFLVVSCPCALVISVPLGFFGGIGAASKQGILIKGSNYLELVSRTDTIVFDKTGTLTKGEFRVNKIIARDEDRLLFLAAYGESCSTHPIALSIREEYERRQGRVDAGRVYDVTETPGFGISAVVDGQTVLIGNGKLLEANGISYEHCEEAGTAVYVAADGSFEGVLVISDGIKEGAADAVRELKNLGVGRSVMLTGDRKETAKAVAEALKTDEYYAELLPGDKVDMVEKLMNGKRDRKCLVFAGDGINDAPVLARADVGIAMGAMGSDAAIEAADIVLMDDDIRKIAAVVRISRRTIRIVRQNIVLALSVKLLVLILSALGIANMWAAVFADVGVCVLAILNSMRALYNNAGI
jgi:Cd2+/Zn2+-exporting ATPase